MRDLEVIDEDNQMIVRSPGADSLLRSHLAIVASILTLLALSYWIMVLSDLGMFLKQLLFVFCFSFSGALAAGLFAESYETRIDREKKTIAIRRRNAFRDKFKVYKFEDIASGPTVAKSGWMTGSGLSELFVVLKSGEKIRLAAPRKSTEQLEIVETWLSGALPALPSSRSRRRVLKSGS